MTKKKQIEESADVIHKTNEPHILPCPLGPKERAEAAQELANAISEGESLELEKKSVTASFKSRLDSVKERIHNLSRKVKDGVEMKSVDCELQLNHTKLTATLVRLDTKEFIEERPLTQEEKQMNLEDDF
jgi:hypothetical protein